MSKNTVVLHAAIAGAVVLLAAQPPAWGQSVPTITSTVTADTGGNADDPSIWIHPTDPALSAVIGTAKDTALVVFDMAGDEISRVRKGVSPNNVDVRHGFILDGQQVDLITASDRGADRIAIYKMDPASRTLIDVAASDTSVGISPYGMCMYVSPVSGKFYHFVTSKSSEVEQWELVDDGNGNVDAVLARAFSLPPPPAGLGNTAEGCVADDQLGYLYVGQEDVAIWKYGAEPEDSTVPILQVDVTTAVDPDNGHLTADVEGLALYYASDFTGYLIASSQGNNEKAVYRREGNNQWLFNFDVTDMGSTDGLDVTNFPLGDSFPLGLFVGHDGGSGFGYIPWENIANLVDPPLTIDPIYDPRQVGGGVPGNTAPVAVGDMDATDEDVGITIDVLFNDFDDDLDPVLLSFFDATSAAGGSVSRVDNGTPNDLGDDELDYTPAPDFFGTDTFGYTVSDGRGGSASATVTVTVDPVPDPPTAADDTSGTDVDTPVTIDVLANDSDPDPDVLLLSDFDQVTAGGQAVTRDNRGTPGDQSDDWLIYSPTGGFSGPDSFGYTITDGTFNDTAQVAVTVAPNLDPQADDDADGTAINTPVTIDVLANDNDPDGDDVLLESFDALSVWGGTVTRDDNQSPGDLADDLLIYLPPPDFSGTDSFGYQVSDGRGGTDTALVTVSVSTTSADITVEETVSGTAAAGSVTSVTTSNSITGVPGGFYLASVSTRRNVDVTDVTGLGLTWLELEDQCSGRGVVRHAVWWAQGSAMTGAVTAELGGAARTAIVVVTRISGVDPDTPIGNHTAANTNGVHGACSGGSDSPNPSVELVVPEAGSMAFGSVNPRNGGFTPAAGFAQIVEVAAGSGGNAIRANQFARTVDTAGPVAVEGSIGKDKDWALVAVEVRAGTGLPPNTPPDAADDMATVVEDGSVVIDVLANDTDPDPGDTIALGWVGSAANGTVVVNVDETITYIPDPDFFGTDNFEYEAVDGRGGTSMGTVVVAVTAVNDSPSADNDSATTEEATSVVIDVLANDTDPDPGDPLTVISVTQPANGSASINPDYTVTYSPNPSFVGGDSFDYTVTDGQESDQATVTVTVTDVNHPPVADDDAETTDEDNAVVIDVLANDSDPDAQDTLSVAIVSQGSKGTASVNPDMTVTFTPDPDLFGGDSFVYEVTDGRGGADQATVAVTINPINDAPVAGDDSATTTEMTAVTIEVLSNDTDADPGDVLTVSSATHGSNGTTEVNADGTVTYTPAGGFSGTDSFDYTVADLQAASDQASVTITVGSASPAEVILEETVSGAMSGSNPISVTTSSSIAGITGHLYLAAVSTKPNRSVTSVTGLGLTWTRVGAQCGGRNATNTEVWMAIGSATSGTVTASLAVGARALVISVSRFSGVDTSQPIGAVATANTNGVSGACSGGSDTAAYAVNLTTSAANAFVYSAVGLRRKSHSPGAGFTEIDEVHGGSGGSTAGVATQGMTAATPGAQTVNGSISGTVDWGVVALEIRPL